MKVIIVHEDGESMADDYSVFMCLLKEVLPKIKVYLVSDTDPHWAEKVIKIEENQ